jgi:hypothetical protein
MGEIVNWSQKKQQIIQDFLGVAEVPQVVCPINGTLINIDELHAY